MFAHAVALGLAFALLGTAGRARAQDAGIAEKLFIEGKALMQEKKYPEACLKLQASHDLDKTATGTLLNLALCHELINKPATAWAEFRQVIAESTGRREDRVTLAREHEEKLKPILSHIRILVAPDARVRQLTIQLDALTIPEVTWGGELPVDPGKHSIAAAAPGKIARTTEFVVGDAADRKTLVVEPLANAPPDVVAEEDRKRREAQRTRRTIGFVVGGAGLVAVGVSLVVGLAASNKNSNATDLCPKDLCRSQDDKERASSMLASADRTADTANVIALAGSSLLVGGIVLVMTALSTSSPTQPAKATAFRAAPIPLAHGGGLSIGGEF